jgi:hypothetical protein
MRMKASIVKQTECIRGHIEYVETADKWPEGTPGHM